LSRSGSSSGRPPTPDPTWSLINPHFLVRWAWRQTNLAEAALVLEWVHDELLVDPDRGLQISEYGRAAIVPDTDVELVWEIYPAEHAVDVVSVEGEREDRP